MGNKSSTSGEAGTTLEELSVQLSEGRFRDVVVMCGAGISTSAGVPDFRSPSAGLYFKLKKYNLPYPEAVFDSSYFAQNPLPFYSLVRDIFPEQLRPTLTHRFLTLLHQKGYLRRIYTQNIDGLEGIAGVPDDKIVEAHGSFRRAYCVQCKSDYDLPWLKAEIFRPEGNGGVPKCERCRTGVVRPDVVLFGESLPGRFWSLIDQDFGKCDLLLVFGTSLTVSPFNTLVMKPKNCSRVYINRTKPGASGFLGWVLGLNRSIQFEGTRDLVVMDDCDDTVQRIVTQGNWQEDMDRIESVTVTI